MRTLDLGAAVRRPSQQFTGPQGARVARLAGDDLFVELDATPGLEVGPCAWSRPSSLEPLNPPAGTRCLVLFAGAGVTDPWCVTFDRWPA